MATSVDAVSSAAATTSASKSKSVSANEAGSADRFLKLLVAQMQNQDPLNPLDNAQVTSQMAQIQTVSGIEKMNRTIEGMNTSFAQLQQMQSSALVGRGVLVEGSNLYFDAKGGTGGGYDLERSADAVKLDIIGTNGDVLDSVDLGPQSSGRHSFDWKLKSGINPALVGGFEIRASYGTGEVKATSLMRDTVQAVLTGGNQLTLELSNSGNVPYSTVKAFH
jgi:flagellar basal-body rod modification protein FlgD